ncbi:MAG: CcdB family protein [Castellaniella sp.]|uniref:CcdB family protein n=1 Tax=Castellaniella sp. TaxID=1955812 RepID=UPI003C73809F
MSQGLCPIVEIDHEPLALMPHLAAPLDKRLLRQPILSIAHRAHEVRAALDAVTSGI